MSQTTGTLCSVCEFFEAEVAEVVENAETGERKEVALCIECRDKGLAYGRGEDVSFEPENRLSDLVDGNESRTDE